jgi:antitoxin YefM
MKRNSDRGLKETEFLLRAPANAKRLLEALRESKEGKGQVMSIEELRKSVGLDKKDS